jgi:hypothetical protein
LTFPVALILLSALGGILPRLILTRLILSIVGTLIDVGHLETPRLVDHRLAHSRAGFSAAM